MAEDFGDKTEAPTPRRRLEAREQGNVPRSADLSSAVMLLGMLLMLNWYGQGIVQALRGIMDKMLGRASLVYAIGMRIGIVLLILALLDYAYQRFRTEKELKMSKQEVKEEMRRMEGDPKIKQRRRQIALQATVQRLKKDVPTADIVVTNP